MSTKNVYAFIEKMEKDIAFRESVLEAKTMEEKSGLIRNNGFEFTSEEFKSIIKQIYDAAFYEDHHRSDPDDPKLYINKLNRDWWLSQNFYA